MARTWLSFWNQETRERRRSPGRAPADFDVCVPYGKDKLAKGDKVYYVVIDGGELLLFGRIVVGRTDNDSVHAESLNVWAEPDTEIDFFEGQAIDDAVVDELVYLKADGSEQRLFPNTPCDLGGSACQGRSSIRELTRGSESSTSSPPGSGDTAVSCSRVGRRYDS
jgi:hypothetical protein